MKKLVIGIMIVILLSVILCVVSSSSVNEEQEIVIGYATPLTGDGAFWGLQGKKGFEFGVNEINSKGGINGKQLKIIYEDTQCDGKTGLEVFSKLINIDNIKIITGTMCSTVAHSVIPSTQENNIFYLASAASEDSVPKRGDLVFRLWPSDVYEAKYIAEYAIKEKNAKKFSIMYFADNPAGGAAKDVFVETVNMNGGKVLETVPVVKDTKDLTTSLLKLIKGNPDTIYLVAYTEQLSLAINKLRELGYNGLIFAYSSYVSSEEVISQIGNKKNIFYAEIKNIQEGTFWKEFKEVTGEEADTLIAVGYDSAKLLEYSLDACGEDIICMKNKILNTKDWQSARGKFSFDKYGDVTNLELEIKTLE
jgi:branched-chain amino acid transport system substrate-binding protein